MAVPWALPAPLSPAQLKRLEQHRYSAAGRSLLEPWLQPYWAWLVEQVPLGLAPNAITLGGLLLNCLTALPLIACCPSATEQVPLATARRRPSVRARPLPLPARALSRRLSSGALTRPPPPAVRLPQLGSGRPGAVEPPRASRWCPGLRPPQGVALCRLRLQRGDRGAWPGGGGCGSALRNPGSGDAGVTLWGSRGQAGGGC